MADDAGFRLFVTVGTTNFDPLIMKLHEKEILGILRAKYGVKFITLQLGHGTCPIKDIPAGSQEDVCYDLHGVTFTTFRLKPNIATYIDGADLVISHAGAGSIMETLRARKKLIVVVNDALMDNHQEELAFAMADGQHARATTCSQLLADLTAWAESDEPIPCEPLPEPDTDLLLSELNDAAGCEMFVKRGDK